MFKRNVFCTDPDFILKWEKLNDQLFVHIEILQVTPKIISKIKKAWLRFQAQAYFEGYENIYTYTEDPRIVTIVGGAIELKDEKLNNAPGWRVFKWELK